MPDLAPYIGSVLVVLAGLLLLGFRRRILLRLGVRNFLRRKSQVALAVAGLFVATAIISGALVMGDSFDVTVQDVIFRGSHLVDEIVWRPDETGTRTHTSFVARPKGFFNESVYDSLRDRIGQMPHIDGIAPRIVLSASIRNLDTEFVEPASRLIAVDPARDFDAFLVDGSSYDATDLPPGHAVVNAKLADHLQARRGHRLEVFTAFNPNGTALTVHRIVDNDAKGGFFDEPNVFVQLFDAQSFLNVSGRVNAIFVSNVGGVRDGHLATDRALGELGAVLPDLLPGYKIDALKKEGLEEAESSIQWVTQLFGVLGIFTIIAGVLLIMNIFVVLAEERKSEMGMSRALGMRRLHLTETFVFEGLLYALAASAIGAVAGLGVAGFIILAFRALFTGISTFAPEYAFESSSLVIAFSIGFLVTMAVVTLASWRVSRLNIVRAIRNIPEPILRTGTRRQWILGSLGVAVGAATTWRATVLESNLLAMVGPTLLAYGAAAVVQRIAGTRAAYTAASVAIVAWALLPARFELYPTESPPLDAFVASGIILVLSAVVLLMMNSRWLLTAVTRLAGRRKLLRAVVKTSVSYPMARKGRTGLSLAMFALVVFIITVTSMFAALFLGNVEQLMREQSGGYDIGARANILRPGADFAGDFTNASVSSKVAYYSAFVGSQGILVNESEKPIDYPVYGIPAGFASQTQFSFVSLLPEYATASEAWMALETDPSLAIFDGGVSGGFGGAFTIAAGDRVRVRNLFCNIPGHPLCGERVFTAIGVLHEFLIPGMFLGDQSARDFFSAQTPIAFLFKVAPGHEPSVVERELERDLRRYGIDATVFRELIEGIAEINLSFIRIMQAFLALGLFVGVAGLGVVTMRNVVERRSEIGTLRAIGFRRTMVLKYLLIENSFVSLLGIGIGIALGIAYAYDIFLLFLQGAASPFVVPWLDLAGIASIAYGAGLLSTFPPSRKAARMPPAQALRIVE